MLLSVEPAASRAVGFSLGNTRSSKHGGVSKPERKNGVHTLSVWCEGHGAL